LLLNFVISFFEVKCWVIVLIVVVDVMQTLNFGILIFNGLICLCQVIIRFVSLILSLLQFCREFLIFLQGFLQLHLHLLLFFHQLRIGLCERFQFLLLLIQ